MDDNLLREMQKYEKFIKPLGGVANRLEEEIRKLEQFRDPMDRLDPSGFMRQVAELQKINQSLKEMSVKPSLSDESLGKPDYLERERKIQENSMRQMNETYARQVNNHPGNAQRFVEAVSSYYKSFEDELKPDHQIVFWVVLNNGEKFRVVNVRAKSFDILLIEGVRDNALPCWALAHQSSIQFYVEVEPITKESPRRSIGFFAQLDNLAQSQDSQDELTVPQES